MKRIPKPPVKGLAELLNPLPEAQFVSDVSVQRLIEDSLVSLQRETKNILTLSARGKLDAATARDLRDNLKLLFELKAREDDFLKGLSDEDLENLANKKEDEPDDV